MAGVGGDADGNIDLTVDQSVLQPDLVRGLANTGNTCFLNSTLQAVAPLGSVHEWMRSILVAGVQARLHQLQNAEARRLGSAAGVHAGAATFAGLDAAGDDGTEGVWHSIGATTAKLLGILRALNWPLHSSGAEVGVGRSSNNNDNATGGSSALGKLAAFAGAAASALLDSAATAPLVPRLALGQLSSFFESQGGQQHDAHELFLIMIASIEDGDRDSVLQAVAEVRRKQRWLMAAMTVNQPPSVRRTNDANTRVHTQVPQVEVGFTTPVKGGLGKIDDIDHQGSNSNSKEIQRVIASSRQAWARAAAAAASRQRTGGSSRPRDASASAAVGARSTMAGSRIGGFEDLCGGGSISLSNPFTCIVGRRTECLACREATLTQQQQQRSPSSSAASSGGIGQGSSGGGGDMISAWTLSNEVSLTLNPPDPHTSMMMAGFGGGGSGSMPTTTTTSIEMLLRQYFSSNPTSGWMCSNPACSHVAHASRMDRATGREVLLNRILEHNALRRTVLFACPPVLNLHISRLQPGYKNSAHVRFDLVLDLKPYTLQGHFGSAHAAAAESATHGVGGNTSKSSVLKPGVASATEKGKGTSASTSTTSNSNSTGNSTTMYDLMSCIVHLGGPYSGHYITYRRVPCVVQLQRTTTAGAAAAVSQDAPTQTGWQWEKGSSRHPKVWVLCSDSDVQALGEQQQQRRAESTVGGGGGDAVDDGVDHDDSGRAGGEDADETGSGSVRYARAYMLFYARRDTLRLPEPHGAHDREAAAPAGNGSKSSGRAQSRLSSPGAPAAGLVLGTRDSHGAKWSTDAAAREVLASQTRALHGHATAAMAEELTPSRMLMLHPLELATAGKRGGWDATSTSTSEIESARGSFKAMVCWYPPAGKLQ